MTLKQNWEKTETQHQLPIEVIEAMVGIATPAKKLQSFKIISGGCANLNHYICLELDKEPTILRIYLRDPAAAYREQKLGQVLKKTVPLPQINFIGDYQHYRFAFVSYLPGITLRELLLSHESHDFSDLMVDIGVMLTKIRNYVFDMAGFFDKNLKVVQPTSQEGYREYVQDCIQQTVVIESLAPEVLHSVSNLLEKFWMFFPDKNEKNLVHADFDPANILVVKQNNQWQISGILDWEFSFSGSSLCDVANMLRYAHQMPVWFEKSFLQGLKIGGYQLPEQWQISVHLLNLLSLLDSLARSSDDRPNQRQDICNLIDHIVIQLREYKNSK